MTARLALMLTFALSLACAGGASVDPRDHLMPLCEAPVVPVPLIELDLPASELPDGVSLTVSTGGFAVGGDQVDDRRLSDRLRQEAEFSVIRGGGKALRLFVEPAAPMTRVAEALTAANDAGFEVAHAVVASPTPAALPDYPDPVYAGELRERTGSSPDVRVAQLVAEIVDQIRLCPPAMEVFNVLPMASEEHRCELLAAGLSEALPLCVLTNRDRVVTLAQMLVEPVSPLAPTHVRLELPAPDLPAGTWADAAPWLMARRG